MFRFIGPPSYAVVDTNSRVDMRWELLERFLGQRCDEAERHEVLRWAAQSVRNRQVLDELARAFQASGDAPSVRTEWDRLRRTLNRVPKPKEEEEPG